MLHVWGKKQKVHKHIQSYFVLQLDCGFKAHSKKRQDIPNEAQDQAHNPSKGPCLIHGCWDNLRLTVRAAGVYRRLAESLHHRHLRLGDHHSSPLLVAILGLTVLRLATILGLAIGWLSIAWLTCQRNNMYYKHWSQRQNADPGR
jgi:hypothetical protein